MTPSSLKTPTLLMNFPFTVDNSFTNNVLMEPYAGQKYNYDIAFAQFTDLFKEITKDALVYLLPSEGNFQDQAYVANLGCYLPHIKNKDIILMANFKSIPRMGEEKVGVKFLSSMGYYVVQPPTCWEGEADLKYLRDNIYFAGYGIRTDITTHHWMRDLFGMEVVSIKMDDPKLYHFDCSFFPMTKDKVMVAVDAIEPYDLKNIEKYAEIVPVPKEFMYDGWTNSLVLGNKILHAPARTPGSEQAFKDTVIKHGFEPVIVYLCEFEKSGADLSCMVMHLNYF